MAPIGVWHPGAARPFPYGSPLADLLNWPPEEDGEPPEEDGDPPEQDGDPPKEDGDPPEQAQPAVSAVSAATSPSKPRFGLAATDAGLASLLEQSRAAARLKASIKANQVIKAAAEEHRTENAREQSAVFWRVAPIWRKVQGWGSAAGEPLPAYEECFQGF